MNHLDGSLNSLISSLPEATKILVGDTGFILFSLLIPAVSYGLAHRELGEVLYIGVDELSRRKEHVYVTNVYDLKEKRLLWSGEGNDKEALKAFFVEHGQ